MAMKRLLPILTLAILATLALSVGATDAGSAQADFERANTELSKARQPDGQYDVGRLRQAESAYQSCLAHHTDKAGESRLFEDARYNLELTRLLLAQASPRDKASDNSAQHSDDPKGKSETGAKNSSPQQQAWGRPKEPQPDCCPT
jgi:hypothetical protein